MPQLGLYLHIPFCVKKCDYCDFPSYADKFQFVHQYIDALGREIDWYCEKRLFTRYTPVTIYVGGGTPSLATEQILQFLSTYRTALQWDRLREKTIEVNPGAVTSDQLRALQTAGFNRVSIGIQSFDNDELQTLGRMHSRDEALECFQQAREAGFQNISLDLIFGIPTSTLASWERSVQQALDLKPEHVSMYNLTIEAGTPFAQKQQQGYLQLPDDDMQLAMYETGVERLEAAGYTQYEISNFARPNYRCVHNQIYWRNEEYVGLGAAAHSYLQGLRYWNTSEVIPYIVKSTEPVEDNAYYPATVESEERLDLPAQMGETIMMSLRMREGIDLNAFASRFDQRLESLYKPVIDSFAQQGLLEIYDRHLRLTRRGVPVSNIIFQEFLA